MPISPFCCNAQSRMLPCKQAHCLWHLVYIIWPQMMSRPVAGPPAKGDTNVQDHRPHARALLHAVRPPDGLDRPPADEERGDLQPQWRPAALRPLRPEDSARCTAIVSSQVATLNLRPMAPIFGAIFLRAELLSLR